jgi:hypothetical protein
LEISRWDEVSFKITPSDVKDIPEKDRTLTFENDKTKFVTPKKDFILYEMSASKDNPEGAFEYEIDLKEKPDTNVISFNLETQGVDFFYQPPLNEEKQEDGLICTATECKDKDGNIRSQRPENVVGSYAIYASEQKTNYVGGKEYKTGKVGHIFRPKIIDSAGTEVWGDLHIEKGILSVTIPQEFLDKAVYPVRHATGLQIGYGGTGGATTSSTGTNYVGYRYTEASGGGVISSMSVFAKKISADTNLRTGIYDIASPANLKVDAGVVLVNSTTGQWWNFPSANFTYGAGFTFVASTVYNIGISSAGNNVIAYYDSVSTTEYYFSNSGTAYTTPQTMSIYTGAGLQRWYNYATYDAGGGGSTVSATAQIKGKTLQIKGKTLQIK